MREDVAQHLHHGHAVHNFGGQVHTRELDGAQRGFLHTASCVGY